MAFWWILLSVLTFSLSSQQPPPTNSDKITVSGTVFDSLSKEPLRKVDLTLSPISRKRSKSYGATSNADGTFIFRDVEPGTYHLWGEKLGYIEGAYGGAGPGEGIELRLSAAQKLDNLQFLLTPQAVISGRVVDQDGDPYGKCGVSVFSYAWQHGKRQQQYREGGTVDDRGEFRFARLQAGKYYLSADPSQFRRQSGQTGTSPHHEVVTYYPATLNEEDAVPIVVTAGQQVSNIEIKLQKGTVYSVSGKVIGLEDIPESREFFGGRHVRLRRIGSSGFSGGFNGAMLETNGSFEIAGVQPGMYELSVGQSPGATLARTTVEVADRNVDNLIVQALPPQPLSGKLRVEGNDKADLARVTIALQTMDEEFRGMPARVKADGTFEFSGVGPGKYRLNIWNKPEATYLKSIRLGESESADGTTDISTGNRGELNILLGADGAEIHGTIKNDSAETDHSAPSAKDAKIVLIPDITDPHRREEHTLEAVFDQYGAFTIKGIAPGRYKLYAWEKIEEDAWENPDLLKQMDANAVDVSLDANEKKQLQVSLMSAGAVAEAMTRAGME